MSKASDYGLSDKRFVPVAVDCDVKALVTWSGDSEGFVFRYTKEARDEIAEEFDWVSESWCPKKGFNIGAKYLLLVDLSSDAYIVDMEYLRKVFTIGVNDTITNMINTTVKEG